MTDGVMITDSPDKDQMVADIFIASDPRDDYSTKLTNPIVEDDTVIAYPSRTTKLWRTCKLKIPSLTIARWASCTRSGHQYSANNTVPDRDCTLIIRWSDQIGSFDHRMEKSFDHTIQSIVICVIVSDLVPSTFATSDWSCEGTSCYVIKFCGRW